MEKFVEYIIHVIIIGIPSALIFFISCKLTKSQWPWVSLAAGGISFIVLVGLVPIIWPESEQVQVAIDSPLEGQTIEGNWIVVNGSVSNIGAKVYLLVHPYGDAKWWVQPNAIVVGKSWKCEANLGTPKEGKGECFQLVAVVSEDPWFIDILKAKSLWNRPTCLRPPHLPSSSIVTVWRSK